MPLAGRSLIERQARLAGQAGASPVVILVERVPAELAAVIERLRSEGIAAVIARSVADAAQAVPPGDRLLVLADGLVADRAHVARLVGAGTPALLTVPETGTDDRFERIDADARWAGIALLDGAFLRETAGMLQDWDLQSTLLRRAVQSGARQIALRADLAEPPLTIAESGGDLQAVQSRIVEGAGGTGDDWASHFLLAPIEASATRALMPTALTPSWLLIGAGVLTGLAATLFASGWLLIGGLMLLLATPLDGIAERLAALRVEPSQRGSWPARALPYLAGAALAALSYRLSEERGWGCLAVAGATIAFLWALSREVGRRRLPERLFFAERKGMTWAMLPFALTGAWVTGLLALAAYAGGSFFWAQKEVHRRRGNQD